MNADLTKAYNDLYGSKSIRLSFLCTVMKTRCDLVCSGLSVCLPIEFSQKPVGNSKTQRLTGMTTGSRNLGILKFGVTSLSIRKLHQTIIGISKLQPGKARLSDR